MFGATSIVRQEAIPLRTTKDPQISGLEPRVSLECTVATQQCSFQFWAKNETTYDETFTCQLAGCTQNPDNPNPDVQCDTARCQCMPGNEICEAIEGLINKVKGTSQWHCTSRNLTDCVFNRTRTTETSQAHFVHRGHSECIFQGWRSAVVQGGRVLRAP